MARILAVGIATLDIINQVDRYPAEDAEVRASAQHLRRGGNATNTLVVLSQLGHDCHWAGVMAEERDSQPILADLARHGIDISQVRWHTQGKVPTSYITLSAASGSRTIVHYRDLPEYSLEDFRSIELRPYQWLHFEGRAVDDTAAMLSLAKQQRPKLPRSVEIEKPRPGIERLFADASVLLFSQVYARHAGFDHAEPFLASMRTQAPDAVLACGWGAKGAFAVGMDGEVLHAPAYPPTQLVDTLGAGDTFNAGFIHASLQGWTLADCLNYACRLAGKKCGQLGFDDLHLLE